MGGGVAEPHWQMNEALVGQDVTQLAGGRFATLALCASGAVYCWGTPDQDHELSYARSRRPKALTLAGKLAGTTVAQVAVAEQSVLLLSMGGELLQWEGGYDEPEPLQVGAGLSGGLKVVQVACGEAHSLALSEAGALFAWGNGEEGQLGLGDFDDRDEGPEAVELPEGTLVRFICAAGAVSMALTADGGVLSCGNDELGQLGHAPSGQSSEDASAELQELDLGKCCEFTPAR